MTREEIKAAAMKASKDYGYALVWGSFDFEVEDGEEDDMDRFKRVMKEKGCYQVCIYDGEEPYYAMDNVLLDEEIDMGEVMEDGEVFNENDVYRWITLGRIEAWKEILRRKSKKNSVGYFCDGYRAYVFDPKRKNVYMLKQQGEVVVA